MRGLAWALRCPTADFRQRLRIPCRHRTTVLVGQAQRHRSRRDAAESPAATGRRPVQRGLRSFLTGERRRRVFSYAAIMGVTEIPWTTIEVTTTDNVSATNESANDGGRPWLTAYMR